MPQVISTAQMRALEKEAIDSGQVSGFELMERAGRGVVDAIFEAWPDLRNAVPRHATVLAGPGNNGGDGFVITRLLRNLGWQVDLVAIGSKAGHSPDARMMIDLLETSPDFIDPKDVARVGGVEIDSETQLVVDAVFGIGITRPLGAAFKELLCQNMRGLKDRNLPARCVSVDVPSGLDADSGEPPGGDDGDAFHADLTVTFHALKPGHTTETGQRYCGSTVVKDIGL